MAEETTKSKPKKKGLHGWKAFGAVFGCGTLAAVLMFAVVVGGGRLIVSSLTGDPDSSGSSGPVPEPKPRPSLDVASVEACKYIQSFGLLKANEAKRQGEEGENYQDREVDGQGRVVSDSCTWNVSSPDGEDWEFTFSFDAFVGPPEGEKMTELARSEYEAQLGQLPEEYESIDAEKDDKQSADEGRYFYGMLSSDDNGPTYTRVALGKNAVYRIRLSDTTEPSLRVGEVSTVEEFQQASRLTDRRMSGLFERVLPDDIS